MKFLLISRWWGDKFKKKAKEWESNAKKHKIEYYLHNDTKMENCKYQLTLNAKAKFILKCLEKFKQPVLYTDVDMKIHQYPKLFENKYNVDLMCFNWNFDKRVTNILNPYILETSSGLLYFNYTPNAIKLLKKWICALNTKCLKYKADDRVLSLVFHKSKAINWLKTQWLPFEYFYLKKYYSKQNMGKIVISHPYSLTSEDIALKDSPLSSRIPDNYYTIVKNLRKTKFEDLAYVKDIEYKKSLI